MSGIAKKMLQAAAGAGGPSVGSYLAFGNSVAGTGRVTLLDHTEPGTLVFSDLYSNINNDIRALTFDANGEYLVVSHAQPPYLTILDHTTPGSLTFSSTYSLGGTNNDSQFSPDGSYLAAGSGADVVLFDYSAGSVTFAATYTCLADVNALSFSPDGKYIAVGVNSSSQPVALLDHTTSGSLTLAATYNFSRAAQGISFSPDGNYIGVGLDATANFQLMDHTTAGSLSVADTYVVSDCREVRYRPDGEQIAVALPSNQVLFLDATTAGSISKQTSFSLSGQGRAIAWTADSSFIAASDQNSPYFRLLFPNNFGGYTQAATYTPYDNTSPGAISFTPN